MRKHQWHVCDSSGSSRDAPVLPKSAVAPSTKSAQMRPLFTFCCFSGLAMSTACCAVTVVTSARLAGAPGPNSSSAAAAAAAAEVARRARGCGAAAAAAASRPCNE